MKGGGRKGHRCLAAESRRAQRVCDPVGAPQSSGAAVGWSPATCGFKAGRCSTLTGSSPRHAIGLGVLVNNRPALAGNRKGSTGPADQAYAFQAELEVRSNEPFVPRPDPRGRQASEWDDRVADLHYADTPEYAVGHGVSAEWEVDDGDCRLLRTAWIPSATVTVTKPAEAPDAVLSMESLGALSDGKAARAALMPLVEQYRAWIETRRDTLVVDGDRKETAEELLRLAAFAAEPYGTRDPASCGRLRCP